MDRESAPFLEVTSAEIARAPYTINTAETLLQIIAHSLPSDITVGPYDQTELLDDGYGLLGQRYAIVAISSNSGWDWNILLFNAAETGWRQIARTRLIGQKGWTPEAAYVAGQPGALVLTHVHGYGTGVFQRFTTWYRISEGELNTLFSYPYSFYVVGYVRPLRTDLTSQVIRMPGRLVQGEKLGLHFQIEYVMQSDDGHSEGALISSDTICFLE